MTSLPPPDPHSHLERDRVLRRRGDVIVAVVAGQQDRHGLVRSLNASMTQRDAVGARRVHERGLVWRFGFVAELGLLELFLLLLVVADCDVRGGAAEVSVSVCEPVSAEVR